MSYNLRQRKPNQRQGAMAEINDEDGALLLETPHCLESSNLLESSARRSRTKRVRMQGPTCYNNPSSSEEEDNQHIAVHKHPRLSELKPPSRSDGFSTKLSSLLILNWKSEKLISYIKEADDADDMIDMSSDAFTSLDALRVDYTPLYKAVYLVISHQCDKEALAKQKLHSEFEIKAGHDQVALEFSKEGERCTVYDRALKEAQDDINERTDEIKLLSRMLRRRRGKRQKPRPRLLLHELKEFLVGRPVTRLNKS
ncbi:uncharacterized protein LOC143537640 [Bidens hawaiensis]|uniref:uncharacterized protein LOC143537640 n=1 Tax=Bidens hawaiensis TaxID=980011 RepID=UPI00404AC7B0